MLSPMTALWTSSEAVMTVSWQPDPKMNPAISESRSSFPGSQLVPSPLPACGERSASASMRGGGWRGKASDRLPHRPVSGKSPSPRPSPRKRGEGAPFISVIGRSVIGRCQLRHQSGDPVLHLGERHGVDDLVGDAVVILSPEMCLAPEVVELDSVQGIGDLLRIEALSLLHRGDKSKGGICEVDARRIPLAVLLAIARLPALDLIRQRILDIPMYPHALDVRLARDVRDHRGVDLPDVNKAPLETELAGLFDDQADATGRRCVHADDVRFLREDAQ